MRLTGGIEYGDDGFSSNKFGARVGLVVLFGGRNRANADYRSRTATTRVEMTIIMAVLERFAGRVYPEATGWVVWVLGWMASYYAIEDIFRVIFDSISNSKSVAEHTKIFAYFSITIAFSLVIWILVRPLVLALATMPLIP